MVLTPNMLAVIMRISYYKVDSDSLAKTFCKISEKCYYSGKKTQVITVNMHYVTSLDRDLWSYSKKHFIPHGTVNDPEPESQPILIGDRIWPEHRASVFLGVNLNGETLSKLFNLAQERTVQNIERIVVLEDEILGLGPTELNKIMQNNNISLEKLEQFALIEGGKWKPIEA